MRVLCFFILVLAVASTAFSQSAHTSERPNQVLTQEIIITGTGALDSQQLQDISNSLTSRRFRDNEHEIKQRIQDAFQQLGYFDAEVSNLKVRALDPLARPKPVRIEADVAEGPRYTFGAFQFTGNQALTSTELTRMMPLHVGEFFSTGKVRSCLTSMREQYLRMGYINFDVVPATETLSSSQIKLTFDITEGPQFRMGALQIEGKSDNLDQIQQHWTLRTGEPFDATYIDKFVADAKDILPPEFQQSRDLEISSNCKDATVLVRLNLDSKQVVRTPLKDVDCEKEQKKPVTQMK